MLRGKSELRQQNEMGGGGRMLKGNEINNLSKKTTFKIHKYEMYPIEFTTMLFI